MFLTGQTQARSAKSVNVSAQVRPDEQSSRFRALAFTQKLLLY